MELAKTIEQARPLLLVGCGRMGAALARGWIACGLDPAALLVVEPAGRPPLSDDVRHFSDLAKLDEGAAPAAIVLAVKPQRIDSVLPMLQRFAESQPLLLSIAAGIPLSTLEAGLPAAVRAMPNLPASIGKGISAMIANAAVSDTQRALAEALLAAAGEVVWLEDEALMDVVTAVSGSGPAYIFALAEALAEAAHGEGLPEPIAERLARTTVIGAAHLMEQSGSAAGSLREQVTSPGGTTAAALEILATEPSLATLMKKTVAAAAARSRELAGGGAGDATAREIGDR